MKRLLIVGCLVLAGCGSIRNPISQTQVYQLENAYGAVQAVAKAYVSLPFCPAGTSIAQSAVRFCSLREGVKAIGKADQSARVALHSAEDFVRNNPTLSPVSVIASAQSAINAAIQIEAFYGAHQ